VFNIFDWDTYSIEDKSGKQVLFKEYIEKSKDEIGEDGIQRVIDFLITKDIQHSYDTAQTSKFLLDKPTSYFLVGGRGHWVYAVNEGLLKKESAGAGAGAVALSGGNASYNLRTTKKIKNKYYKKESLPSSSSSSSSKTTKKHKKTRRANKNNDNKDNKGNNDNKLQIKKRIKKTIKQ
jgi:hypothetical protein